jgi:hypothetical protein
VRDLESEIERAVVLADPGQAIGPAYLSERIRAGVARAALPQTLGDAIEQLKRRMIEDALRECGSKTRARPSGSGSRGRVSSRCAPPPGLRVGRPGSTARIHAIYLTRGGLFLWLGGGADQPGSVFQIFTSSK